MKYILICFFSLSVSLNSLSQTSKECKDTCLKCLSSVSYYWRLDSLGRNGYRFEVHKCLVNCIKGNVTSEMLLEKLGQPNKMQKDNLGSVFYYYYFFDGRSIPDNEKLAKELMFIFFRFDKGNPNLAYVGIDHFD